jgi:hypothetical protein
MNYQVMNLGFRKNFADKVDWLLHTEGMAFLLPFHHDCRADEMSSRSDAE